MIFIDINLIVGVNLTQKIILIVEEDIETNQGLESGQG